MVIDAHHHFWRYDPVEFSGFDESRAALRKDFLPDELVLAIKSAGVDGTVAVQFRMNMEETRWLLDLATQHDFLRGVVGWVPLVSDHVRADLESLAHHPKLRGVRHVLFAPVEDQFMLRDDFNRGVSLLKEFGLSFDILIREHQLPMTLRFIDKHPDQVFVLDHIGKPKIRTAELEPWARYMKDLARRQNVYCKVSGMVNETDLRTWTPQSLQPYFDVVLEAFTPQRLMIASDWPLCLLACGYKRWIDTLRQWAASLSETERERFFGGTAQEAYKLTP